jgi:hypothetical protein
MISVSSKRCEVGTSCGSTCISKGDRCRKTFSQSVGEGLSKVKENLPHISSHLGINVAAWKTGKVLGPMVASHLESQYGIPREVSQMASEAVIQGVMATVLSSGEIKNLGQAASTLLTETAAAMVGKSAHRQAENALSSVEVREMLKQALPILSGKVAGATVSAGGNKISDLGGLAAKTLKRAGDNMAMLFKSAETSIPQFSEESLPLKSLSETLGDIGLLALVKASFS